jgi:hypothetical protein
MHIKMAPRNRGPSVQFRHAYRKELLMLDLVMLAIGLGFFVLSVGYAYACDRL